MRHTLLVLMSMLALSACRTPSGEGSAVKDGAQPDKTPVIAVIGGFNSCGPYQGDPLSPYGQGMWPKAKAVIDHFASVSGKTPKVLVTCYSSKIDFRWAVAPNAYETIAISPTLKPLKMQELAPALDKIQQQMTALSQSVGSGPLYVVGHSFGGWTSLQTALRFAASPKGLTTLVTIDPISPLNCNPSTYLNAGGLGSNPGCKEAPSDVSTSQRTTIRDRSGRWTHFYQVQFSLLHSSHMPPLVKNESSFTLYMPSPNVATPNVYHSTIATDARVWRYVARALHMDYNLPPPVEGASLALDDAAAAPEAGAEDAYFEGEPEPAPLPPEWSVAL